MSQPEQQSTTAPAVTENVVVETKETPDPVQQEAQRRLEALQQSRAQRAKERELQLLRERSSQGENVSRELQELKQKIQTPELFAKNLKDLGLSPREIMKALAETHESELFGEEEKKPDPVEERFKRLEEQAERIRQREERETADAKRQNEQKIQAQELDAARKLIARNVDRLPTLVSLGDDALSLVLNKAYQFAQENPHEFKMLAPQDFDVFAELAEEEAFTEHSARFKSFLNNPRFRGLLPQVSDEAPVKKKEAPVKIEKKIVPERLLKDEAEIEDQLERKRELAIEKVLAKKKR